MNEPIKILALSFESTIFDVKQHKLFSSLKLKKVLDDIHAAGIYVCIIPTSKNKDEVLSVLDSDLGVDRQYLHENDIWTVQLASINNPENPYKRHYSKDEILDIIVRKYNQDKPYDKADRKNVLYTDENSTIRIAVELAKFRVFRCGLQDNARGESQPEPNFLDTLYGTVLERPMGTLTVASSSSFYGHASETDGLLSRNNRDKNSEFCGNCCTLI